MRAIAETLIVTLSLSLVSSAKPVHRRDLDDFSLAPRGSATLLARQDDKPKPSDYPYGTAYTNEFKWLNWDPKDDNQKKDAQKIHDAFKEWMDFVKEGATAAADKDGDTFKRWFGKQDKPEEIKNVFGNMWDGSNPTKNVANMVCNREDFKKRCKETTAAYTIKDTGEFHVCPYGLKRNQNSDIKCEDLDDSCSAKMRSLPMTLLHEMTHFDDIGSAARGGFDIVDEASGSYDCFKLKDDEKGDNAQNYAWLAGEAYWSKQCKKTFKDPKEGVKNNEDIEDMNDFFPSEPAPSPPTNGAPQPQCSGPVEFHQGEADAAIQSFCGDSRWQTTVIVPLVSYGRGKTSDGRSKALGVGDHFPINNGADNLWLDVSFSEGECMGMFQFDKGSCTKWFGEILNGCDTGGLFPKHGGQIKDVCAVYRMTARPEGEPDPLTLKSTDKNQIGQFTCEDTKVLDANSPLAGTCTCRYTGVPGPTDVFNKPDSGKCADVTFDTDPKIN